MNSTVLSPPPPAAPVPPPPSPFPVPPAAGHQPGLGAAAVVALVALGLVSVALIGALGVVIAVRDRAESATTVTQLLGDRDLVAAMVFVVVLSPVVAGVPVVLWLHRTYRSLHPGERRHRTYWAALAWIVPIAAYVVPVRVVNDIAAAGRSRGARSGADLRRVSLAWALTHWLTDVVAYAAIVVMAEGGRTASVRLGAGIAGLALVMRLTAAALLSWLIVALTRGVRAPQPKPRPGALGARGSVAALLAALALVAGAASVVGAWTPDHPSTGVDPSSVDLLPVEDVAAGDCVRIMTAVAVQRIDCAEPHRGEVSGRASSSEADPAGACHSVTEQYVGTPLLDTPFEAIAIEPAEAPSGTDAVCFVWLPVDGTGSVRGADLTNGWMGHRRAAGLPPGACLAPRTFADALAVTVVDCTQPHDFESVGGGPVDHEEHPGFDALIDAANPICHERFAAHVGISYADSGLAMSIRVPTPEEWTSGERRVLCLVRSDGSVGSVAGVAR